MSLGWRRALAAAGGSAAGVVGMASPAAADLPGVGLVTGIGESVAGLAWDAVAAGLARWVTDAIATFVGGAVGFLLSSSRPNLTAAWFSGGASPFATVRNLSIAATLAFAFVAICGGVLRGDGLAVAARVATAIPATALGVAVAVPVVDVMVRLVDEVSVAVLGPSGDAASAFADGFGSAAAAASGGFAVVAVGIMAVVAALTLWAELLVRSALIYLLVAVSPLVLAALVWPPARGMFRRLVEVLVAAIVAKFVIAVALAVGIAALGNAGEHTQPESSGGVAASVGTLLVGTTVLALAAFSPFVLLRLLPVVETAVLAGGVARGPARVVAAARVAASMSHLAAAGGGAAASSAGTPSASGASPTDRLAGTPTPSPTPTQLPGAAAGRSAAGSGPGPRP